MEQSDTAAAGDYFQHTRDSVPGLCSVICTTYNHAKYSAASIKSIADQDFRPIEIVVIDDGSTDGNVEVLRTALAESGVPHQLITQENTGNVAKNINRALAVAKGEFLVLTSLDDLFLPDCLSSKMKLLLADASLVMVGNSTFREINDEDRVIKDNCTGPVFGREEASAKEMLEIEYETVAGYLVQGTVFRASLISAIGGYEEDVEGDDLIIRTKIWNHLIQNPGLRFTFLRQAGFSYRKHPENLHKNSFRQVRTVVDWRNRFFPDRPLPKRAKRWVCEYFSRCVAERDRAALNDALAYDPLLPQLYADCRKTWRYRRRLVKYWVKRKLARS